MHENPFSGRDFRNVDKVKLQAICCKPTCYDQVKRRGFKCPDGTKMFSQGDEHNPFGYNVDMRAQSKENILAKCCKPLNKCYTKLKSKSLSCDGFGKFPGQCFTDVHRTLLTWKSSTPSRAPPSSPTLLLTDETDEIKYDFDPLALTKDDDIKAKCCKLNCFYAMKKKSLTCKAGLAQRST